jgi:hypothetical protein
LLPIIVLAFVACEQPAPRPVQMGEPMRMGPFLLRAATVEVLIDRPYHRPDEIRVGFVLAGGNRFERMDFADSVTQRGIFVRTAAGWRQECRLEGTSEDQQALAVVAHPPRGSSGFKVEIVNPYGEPARFMVDLGR